MINKINSKFNGHLNMEDSTAVVGSSDRQLKVPKALLVVVLILSLVGCKKFLEVDLSKSKITNDLVFESDVIATSAVYGIYSDMLQGGFASGTSVSVVSLNALSADELNYYSLNQSFKSFEENSIVSDNSNVLVLWESIYSTIYQANSLLEGVRKSSSLSTTVRDQLIGEALFIRAFCHFYLVNFFGDVPWISTTDYKQNATISRTPKLEIYENIIKDLLDAEEIMSDDYVETERVRPNKSSVTALLARCYFYIGDWSNAEIKATAVIDNPKYALLSDLDAVFLMNSSEAIWQLKPYDVFYNTNEGNLFILRSIPDDLNPLAITSELANSFESGDLRRIHWTNSIVDGALTYNYPYKYKKYQGPVNGVDLTEYSMVLRVAEQYLIRSEARAHQGDLSEAISDLDVIRERADLPLIQDINPGISQADLLLAIEQERRVELFCEWGHRWLDLKRANRTDAVLGSIKTDWQSTDALYPIPQTEINKNSNLKPQNSGY